MNKGVVALITILLLGAVIVEISVAGAFLGTLVAQSGYGTRLSSQALTGADAGIQDALLRLARDSNFSGSYSLAVDNVSVGVVVCRNFTVLTSGSSLSCGSPATADIRIAARGTLFAVSRDLQAIVALDSMTGDLRVVSKQQL